MQESFSSLYSKVILNLYIVYALNTWPCNPTNNCTLKNYFFCTVKLVRNTIKSKFTYIRQGIAFDGKCYWSFDNDYARNVVIFGFDNSSSSHTSERKKKILSVR